MPDAGAGVFPMRMPATLAVAISLSIPVLPGYCRRRPVAR